LNWSFHVECIIPKLSSACYIMWSIKRWKLSTIPILMQLWAMDYAFGEIHHIVQKYSKCKRR
jgi:hypothetical protein